MRCQLVFALTESDIGFIDAGYDIVAVFLGSEALALSAKSKINNGLIFTVSITESNIAASGLPEVVGDISAFMGDPKDIKELDYVVFGSGYSTEEMASKAVYYGALRVKNFLLATNSIHNDKYDIDTSETRVLGFDSPYVASGQGIKYFENGQFVFKKISADIESKLFGVFDLSDFIKTVFEFRPTHVYSANGNGVAGWGTPNYELLLFLSNKDIKIVFKTTDTFLHVVPDMLNIIKKENLVYLINRTKECELVSAMGVKAEYSEWAIENAFFEYQKVVNILKVEQKIIFIGSIVNKNYLIDKIRTLTKKIGSKSKSLYTDYLDSYGEQTVKYVKSLESEYEADGLLANFIELQRINLFERLFNFGIEFEVYGGHEHWEHLKNFKYCHEATFREAELYTSSMFVIDFMRAGQDDIFLGDRVPKIFTCKGLPMMNGYTKDLYDMYKFDDRLYYSNPSELLERYYYFCDNPEERYNLIDKYQEFTNLYREDDIMRKLTDAVLEV